jgi:hypothetical protein
MPVQRSSLLMQCMQVDPGIGVPVFADQQDDPRSECAVPR